MDSRQFMDTLIESLNMKNYYLEDPTTFNTVSFKAVTC